MECFRSTSQSCLLEGTSVDSVAYDSPGCSMRTHSEGIQDDMALPTLTPRGLPRWLSSKDSTCNTRAPRDAGSIPGLGRSPGGGHGNPLQYSCLEHPHRPRSLARWSPWGCRVGCDWSDFACMYTYTYTSQPHIFKNQKLVYTAHVVLQPVGCFHLTLSLVTDHLPCGHGSTWKSDFTLFNGFMKFHYVMHCD